jgi:hypothetical protein
MRPFLVPSRGVHDWQARLADPEKHWRAGYSAMALAYSWEDAGQFPREVLALFAASGEPRFAEIELLLAIPEYDVPLPGGDRPSQNDVFALARVAGGLMTVMVEGKAAEPFGPTLEEWRKDASAGKEERLRFLQSKLGLTGALPSEARYQLLHRTASAIIEAQRFTAHDAVMLVHWFGKKSAGMPESFADYQRFTGLFGKQVEDGRLTRLGVNGGITLWSGWANGEERFLHPQ